MSVQIAQHMVWNAKCHKPNHFASVCMSRKQTQVHMVESGDENGSDYDEIKIVDLKPDDEINAVVASKFPRRLFATINIGKTPVHFQFDSGTSSNVISAKTLQSSLGPVELRNTSRMLSMHNRTTVEPLGLCQLELCNTKNGKLYQAEFTVLKDECTPLLGSQTIQEMNLIEVHFENILSLEVKTEKIVLTKEVPGCI